MSQVLCLPACPPPEGRDFPAESGVAPARMGEDDSGEGSVRHLGFDATVAIGPASALGVGFAAIKVLTAIFPIN